jgi:hypothetical protein
MHLKVSWLMTAADREEEARKQAATNRQLAMMQLEQNRMLRERQRARAHQADARNCKEKEQALRNADEQNTSLLLSNVCNFV